MRKITTILTAASALWSGPGLADELAKMPTARWIVNFDDAQCVALRNYGTEQKPLVLALKEPAMGNVMQVSVIRRGMGGKFAQQLDGTITLDGMRPIRQSIVFGFVRDTGNLFFRMNIPRDTFAAIARSRTLRIHAGLDLDETFELVQMDPLLKVLDRCVDDLRQVWNVTDEGVASPKLKTAAKGTLQGLLSGDDYPGVALDNEQRGSVGFALLIDESGKVADCTVIETSGVAALDAQSCATVKARARFAPAVGIDGKPAKASMTSKIVWDISN